MPIRHHIESGDAYLRGYMDRRRFLVSATHFVAGMALLDGIVPQGALAQQVNRNERRMMNSDTQSWMCNFLAVALVPQIRLPEVRRLCISRRIRDGFMPEMATGWIILIPRYPGRRFLAIDSPGDEWRIDHNLGASHLRVTALKSVVFETDDSGNPLSEKVHLLLAGSDRRRGVRGMGESNIFYARR